jgi:hypothetical protein
MFRDLLFRIMEILGCDAKLSHPIQAIGAPGSFACSLDSWQQ